LAAPLTVAGYAFNNTEVNCARVSES